MTTVIRDSTDCTDEKKDYTDEYKNFFRKKSV